MVHQFFSLLVTLLGAGMALANLCLGMRRIQKSDSPFPWILGINVLLLLGMVRWFRSSCMPYACARLPVWLLGMILLLVFLEVYFFIKLISTVQQTNQ